MNAISSRPAGASTATQTLFSPPSPTPPHPPSSPYTFYAGLPSSESYTHIWYPPVMDPFPSSFTPAAKDTETFPGPGPDELLSNSTSPSPQSFTFDRRSSPSASPRASLEPPRVNTPSVPAACLACRSKHLKCDGQTPCSRCTSSNAECVYVASRRGYKGPRRNAGKNANKRHGVSPARSVSGHSAQARGDASVLLSSNNSSIAPTLPSSYSTNMILPDHTSASPFMSPAPSPAPTGNAANMFASYPSVSLDGSELVAGQQHHQIPSQLPLPSFSDQYCDSFYRNFHIAHPFVLPRFALASMLKESTTQPLLAAMRWIGSLYFDAGPARASLFEEAYRQAYEPGRTKDGFLVQAMMLLLLGLDGGSQQAKAREILADVERMALEIGLNTRSFASINGRGLMVLEESWRRTWWDLYVIDGMIAGVHRATNFFLFDVPADVGLPCEEFQYFSGSIPPCMFLEDMDEADFAGDDREFSSFAYRILCARNLGKFMRIPPVMGPEDENLEHIETLLTNWRLHLPASKRNSFYRDGRIDEMMFQAHMMMHATSILVHQPYSQLDTSPTRNVDSCAPHATVASSEEFNAHTKHTIQSANEISKLITHRVPLLSHSHFFACVVTLSSIVHLSKWALFFVPHDDDTLRQQIRLNIGALAQLSLVWNAADNSSREVRNVAQEVYRVKKQQQMAPQYWIGLSQQQVIDNIAADESIINDIDSMQSMSGMSL